MKSSILAGIFATGVVAQSGPWGQCGGLYYTGPTTCTSGWHCVYQNDWYSQCLEGAAGTTAATTTKASTTSTSTTLKTSTTSTATTLKTSTTTSSSAAATSTSASKKFKWFGINQSCAEFGQGTYPGVWGTQFTFPSTSSIQVWHSHPRGPGESLEYR